jgi:hypothetical protein
MTETLKNNAVALAALSVSNMRALPDHTTELVSQVLMGTPLEVFEFKDKFYRVQTPEGYTGWMDAHGLKLMPETELESWRSSRRYLFYEVSGFAADAPGHKGEAVTDLVLGDLFKGEPEIEGYIKLETPDGRIGYVRQSHCISFDHWVGLQPEVGSILAFARQMMGFPYLWGGASSKGVDCSGFTKLLYYTQGIILARDASQQVRYGEKIDISRLENLQLGDLLFFGNSAEQPGHVGIYMGNGDFIHSSGRVHISSIFPGNPKHDPNRNFVAARRVMTSLDAEGIVRVGSHPWYVL